MADIEHCERCGDGPCQQAEGPCPRYQDAETYPRGLTGDAGEVERLRCQLAGAVSLTDAEADALDRLLDAYIGTTTDTDEWVPHLESIRSKLLARGR